jgi:hypothetical protein
MLFAVSSDGCHVGMYQLGNTLGYLLNDIACADISGAHFVSVHKAFVLSQPELLKTSASSLTGSEAEVAALVAAATTTKAAEAIPLSQRMEAYRVDPRYTFFNNLPDKIVHPNPLEPQKVGL